MQRGEIPTPDPFPAPIPCPAVSRATLADSLPTLTSYDEARALWDREIGLSRDRFAGPPTARDMAGRLDVVVMSDLHVPFHEPRLVADALAATTGADLCILLGDVSDAYALSRFLKYESVGFRQEWADVQATLETICEAYPRVRLVLGNHDGRLEKELLGRLTSDMVDAVRWMTGGTLCPLSMLARRYPNIEIVPHETADGHRLDWMTTLGDAVFLHAEKYSRVPGSALRSIEEWIADQSDHFDFAPFRLIVQAHTHQIGMFPWRADKLLVECGCLAKLQGYQTTPRIGGRPQRRGWVTFTQRDGVTDLNSVHVEWADARRRDAA